MTSAGWLLGLAVTAASGLSVPVEQYELENGLTVLLSQDARLPVAAVEMVYLVGSANERPGRSGFAHLFEHLMFQGSQHYDHDYFTPFEPIGADVNGTTSEDRTNYFERVPKNYLDLALWMESERLEYLLPALTQEKFDNQREVVKNERRQRYDNQPYGLAWEWLGHTLYPAGHPYYERPIGSMRDLDAASLDDARSFFQQYYAPKNSALVVVGDFDVPELKRTIERYFAHIPPGQRAKTPDAQPVELETVKHVTLPDDVKLPRIYLAWPSPALFEPGDAELDLFSNVLSEGKTSRLYKPLVYDQKIAKTVEAYQVSQRLSGLYVIEATAAPGVSVDRLSAALMQALETALASAPAPDELERARNAYQKSFYQRVEGVGSRASLLGAYFLHTGKGDYLEADLARYLQATSEGIEKAAQRFLSLKAFVRLDVVPKAASAASPVGGSAAPGGQAP